MSSINDTFGHLAQKNQKALIAYVMAGYPDYDSSMAAVCGLIRGGADIIELGFPFSDPLADGPVIQNAATTSIQSGMSMKLYHDMVRQAREASDIPIVMMTYANVAYSMGYNTFVAESVKAGIDGFILPDMPVEESGEYIEAARMAGADTIFLASPNTSAARVAHIAQASTGFLYLVAVYGTTGTHEGVARYALESLRRTKESVRDLPVGIGFGVGGPDDVRRYAKSGADGIIVGSAILRELAASPRIDIESRISRMTSSLKAATVI